MDLKKLTIVIVTHVYATGPSFKLEEYLTPRVNRLVFIGHPFSYTKDTRSFLRIYENGKLISERKFIRWRGPELLFYVKDALLTLWWLLKINNIDYYFGVDNLNAFIGYMLKIFRKVQKLVYYTIDYVPQRSENPVLNYLYHGLDRLAVAKSNTVWNLSKIMVEARENNGMSKKYRRKQLAVPVGTDTKVKAMPFNQINKNKIVFMGHLRKGQGVDLLITAMKDVAKTIPKAQLLIIGGGPLEDSLKKQAKYLKLEKHIKFSGFIKDFSGVEKHLRDSAVAVAPYTDDKKNFTRFTDPGKPKDYLAHGIPVIITKVPQVAYEIAEKKCGIAIKYSHKELSRAIISLLSNKKILNEYRANALNMAKEYSWDEIFDRALRPTIA